jgi:hypothetical protein
MSSSFRAPSQIGPREKYLLAISSTTYYVPEDGSTFSAIMTTQDFSDSVETDEGTTSSLYRDLGKEVVTINSAQQHVAVYRLCQRVLGATTEGVPVDYDGHDKFYIRVWAADPVANPVTVARIG